MKQQQFLPLPPSYWISLYLWNYSPSVIGSWWEDGGKQKTGSIHSIPALLFYLLDCTGKCIRVKALMKGVCFAKLRCCGKDQERKRARAKPEICIGEGFELHVNQQKKKFESFPKSWLETNIFCCWCWKSDPCWPKWDPELFKAHSWVCHSCRGIARGRREGERQLGFLERLNVISGVHDWQIPWLEQEGGNT